jgi:hypothetical protein
MTFSQSQDIVQIPWFPKTDPPLAGGAKAGEWLTRDQKELANIAKSLVYESSTTRVNALPSPWSRALQFEQAILNSRYPTREALLEEWFGGMACVGLWDIFGLRMDSIRVALQDHINHQDEAVGPFARSLASSRPNGTASLSRYPDGSNPWDIIYVLRLQGAVIGFSSPSTLFCPSVHLPLPIPGMGWTAAGKFSSPVDYLGSSQRLALADWFSHVKTGVLTAPDLHSQSSASQLADVIDGLINRLSGGRLGTPTLSNTARVQNLPAIPSALSMLARPAKGGSSPSQATLELGDRKRRPLRNLKDPQPSEQPKLSWWEKPVVLVDPDMPSKLGISGADIPIYKSATLESIGYDAKQLERQYGGEISVLTPDQIFLDELYLLPGAQVLTNSWLPALLEGVPIVNGEPVTPLLPFRPELRQLFSSRELQQRCELRVVQSNVGVELEVRLSLPFQGQRDGYVLSRSFPLKEQNLVADNVPVITLWPYVSDSNWKLFYLFCEDRPTGLTVDGFGDYELKTAQDRLESVKYFTTPNFPDLVRLSERGQDRGLLPVTLPPAQPSQSDLWRVGIDFGTSFSNFFIDAGDGPKRHHLDTRVLSLTLSQRETRQRLLSQYFIPEEMLPRSENGGNPPTATAISLRGWQEVLGKVPDLFHEARLRVPVPGEFGGSELRTGFKWGQKQYQKPFLLELALLISSNAAANGANEVHWSVSYPSAFYADDVMRYRQLWAAIHEELNKQTGIRHQLVKKGGEEGLQTEAIAFANYFANFKDQRLVHSSCLDIGGGTTDISIWQENNLVHQVSVPYAGRDISSQLLRRKPSFVKSLFPPSLTNEIASDEARARQDRNFTSRLDNIIRYGSDELLAGLDILTAEPSLQLQLQQFLSLLAISYSGLYHYLGHVLKVLRREGKLSRSTPTPVYVGGNGARMLNWLNPGSPFHRGGDIDRLLEAMQIKASGCQPGRAHSILSDDFKNETACGLISDRSEGVKLTGDFDPRNDSMICGSRLEINGLVFNADDRVVIPHEITMIESYTLSDLGSLKTFINNYDTSLAELRIRTLLPVDKLCDLDSFWEQVETEIRALCLARVNVDAHAHESEPGFILGLRAITNALGRLWAERF